MTRTLALQAHGRPVQLDITSRNSSSGLSSADTLDDQSERRGSSGGGGLSSFVGGDTTKSYAGELTNNTASTFGNLQIYIPNYAGSNQKSYSIDSVGENNATDAYQVLSAGKYNQTTAITQVSLRIASSNLAQYSTAYLYGIKNS